MVVQLLEHRDPPRAVEQRARPTAAATGRPTRRRRGAGRSRRPAASTSSSATYTGRVDAAIEHVGRESSAACCAGVTSTERTARSESQQAPARRAGDSAMKKPRSASTRRRSCGSGEPDVVGEPRIGGVGDANDGRRHRLDRTRRPVETRRRISPKNPEKYAPRSLHRPRQRATMHPALPQRSMEDTCESKPAAQQVRRGERDDPQASRRVRDLARRDHHEKRCERRRRCDLRLREVPAHRSSGAHARNPATGETVQVKAKRVARITPLKNFKDAVLSGKACQGRGQEGARRRLRPRRPRPRRLRPRRRPLPRRPSSAPGAQGPPSAADRLADDHRQRSWARAECPGSLAFTLPLSVSVSDPVRSSCFANTAAADAAVPNRVGHDHGEGRAARARRHPRRRRVGARSAPRPTPTYTPETTRHARALVLRDELVPRLFAGAGLDAVRGHHAAQGRAHGRGARRAAAGPTGVSLAAHLGGSATHVDAGVAIGMQRRSRRARRAASPAYAAEGYRSMKLKIAPGHDVDVVAAVRAEVGRDVTLQVDANGSYTLDRRRSPRPRSTRSTSRASNSRSRPTRCSTTRVSPRGCGHRSASTRRSRAPARRAATRSSSARAAVVSIKAGLVGGLDEARRDARRVSRRRRRPRAPAACSRPASAAPRWSRSRRCPGFTVTGDLSASNRYFVDDVTEPFELDDGRLAVPTGPGLGVTPRPDVLAALHDRPRARSSRRCEFGRRCSGLAGGSRSQGRTRTTDSSGCSGSSCNSIGS